MNSSDPSELPSRAQAALAEVIRRRLAGEPQAEEAVIAEHPELADELRAELAKLWVGDDASERTRQTLPPSATTDRLGATIDHVGTPHAGSGADANLDWDVVGAPPPEAARFRKIRPFAAGGVGEVWLALDMQLHREVALKELQQRHQEERFKRERFLVEGHITGVLEHPGIVPVYALGTDAQQHPYYAMRLVRGENLRQAIKTLHADKTVAAKFTRNDLDFRNLLRRFADVCVTVAYAHSRGVLHRDLKPDNVMLGKYGETYVVDWGMARVVGTRAEDFSLVTEEIVRPARLNKDSATQYGSAMGTPGFMSPEQAAGRIDELGVATDVYSLGAILYYILTNQSPIAGDSFTEFLRRVAAGEIDPPQSLNPAAPKALAAVAVKAMATLPADRYASARDVAAEVERWLADEPIAALPEALSERAGRYVRRNYRWLAPLAAASVIIAVGAVIAAASINRARARAEASARAENLAKQQAETNFLKARETVDTWLTGYSEALQSVPVAGVQAIRARMLELAASEYEAFVAAPGADPALQLEQGRTLVRLGSIYRILGRPEDALAKYAAAAEALAKLRAIPSIAQESAASLALARGMHALVTADRGQVDQSDQAFAAAIDELEKTWATETSSADLLAPLVTLWTNRGGVLAKAGRYAEADQAFQQALTLSENLVRLTPDVLASRVAAATAQIGAGQVKLAQGDAPGASRIFEQATKFFDAAAQIDDHDARYLQLAVMANSYGAAARRRLGDAHGEQSAYGKAIVAAQRLLALQPEIPTYRVNLAMMKTDLGQSLVEHFDPVAAEPDLEESVSILANVATEFPAIADYREAWGAALTNLALAAQARGRFDEALMCLDQAAAEFSGLISVSPHVLPYQERAAVTESIAAQVLFSNGRKQDALERFAKASRLFGNLEGSADATAEREFAAALLWSRYGEATIDDDAATAASYFRRAAQKWEAVLAASPDPQFAVAAAWFFATCPDATYRDAARALALAAPPLQNSPTNARYRLTLAAAQAAAGKWDECLTTIDDERAATSPIAPAFDFLRALARDASGDADAAQHCWQNAAQWRAANLPGEWDLRQLQLLTAARLEISEAEPPAPPQAK